MVFPLFAVEPTITSVEADVTAVTTTTTTLSCTATGFPIPFQTWTRNGMEILDSRFEILSNGSVLVISHVGEEDEGEYLCHASNSVGSANTTVTLNVISQSISSVPPTYASTPPTYASRYPPHPTYASRYPPPPHLCL